MRRFVKGSPNADLYAIKKEELALLEQQSEKGSIDIYYGDESGVNQSAYVPYAWQFKEEKVGIKANHGSQLNCFGLLSRDNQFRYQTTTETIDAEFVIALLEKFSFEIKKPTVVILDNARIHTAQVLKERLQCWQKRGLYIFYLPPYSPHLNIIERLWKELKARWLKPQDYHSFDMLCYATQTILANVGKNVTISFSKYC